MTDSREPLILPSDQSRISTVSGAVGNYRVIRLLGRGTMSSVYLAEQVSMARPVALKILSPSLSNDPAFVKRFLREAQASARLNHPNIVSAIAFGELDSRFFLAMEFVDGEALSTILSREGALEENRVVGIGMQVVAALRHAAAHNVIHLDVKPANIMVGKDGNVKLTDFGLAMIMEKPGGAHAGGKALGTPYYMAPEQVEGGSLDWRSDQFSLGASLYEAVTGLKPFQGKSVSDILVKRLFEKPVPAFQAGWGKTGRGFSAVLAKMLSRSPEGRYQSFEELEGDFARIKVGKKPLVAKRHASSSITAPASSSWGSFGYSSAIQRIGEMNAENRWRWIYYSAGMLLACLAVYGILYSKDLMGPLPPQFVDARALAEAEAPLEDKGAMARDNWLGALHLAVKAEQNPTSVNIRRAINSFRLIAQNRDFEGTVYANVARNRIRRLEAVLEKMSEESENATSSESPETAP